MVPTSRQYMQARQHHKIPPISTYAQNLTWLSQPLHVTNNASGHRMSLKAEMLLWSHELPQACWSLHFMTCHSKKCHRPRTSSRSKKPARNRKRGQACCSSREHGHTYTPSDKARFQAYTVTPISASQLTFTSVHYPWYQLVNEPTHTTSARQQYSSHINIELLHMQQQRSPANNSS